MKKILHMFMAMAICAISFAGPSYRAEDLAGVWVVVENSKKTDAMRQMEFRQDGSAVIKYPNTAFSRRWEITGSTLTVYAADDGTTPGPPDRYSIVELDVSRKTLRIRHEKYRRDIKLQKHQ